MENNLKPNQREKDFYEKNLGNAVNLYGEKVTLSGDIQNYSHEKGIVKLINYIKREYNLDGTSQFVESQKEFEFDVILINIREATTSEDRLGRIVKYNEDLKIEEIEKRKKLSRLEKFGEKKDN